MRRFVPVIHPAYTFRQPSALGPLEAHVENFLARAVKGVAPDPMLKVNPGVAELKKLLNQVRRRGIPLSVDVETGRWGHLAPFAQLRSIAVGAAIGPGVGLSWQYPLSVPVRTLLAEAFADVKLTKLFMNGWSYDIPILGRHGLEVRGPVEDIRDLRHALASTSRTSLATQASFYLKCGPWKAEANEEEDDPEGKGHVDEATPLAKLLPYNAEDTVRAAQVRVHLRRELASSGTDRSRIERIYRQSLRLSRVAADMHHRGFPFDRSQQKVLRAQLLETFEREASGLRRLLRRRAPGLRINDKGGVNDTDLAALIYKDCAKPGIKSFGLQVPLTEVAWTESGKPAVNKDALLYLFSLENTPEELKTIIKACWRVDAPLKLKSTYVDSALVESSIGPDGRMHPSINSCGAETYRWTCSHPNLFNIPEAVEEKDESLRGVLPNIRSMYVAPSGYRIVHRDYDQLELQVMAEVTGDVPLRTMLDTGDVHRARARQWFGIPADVEVPNRIRRQSKVVSFSSQYGGGIETVYLIVLEQMQDADYDEIYTLWLRFRDVHTGIVEYWARELEFAETHGYSESMLTQYRRHYPPDAHLKPTETSNYKVQASAAAIANSAMVGFDDADYPKSIHGMLKKHYPDAWLAMHVYDSFDVICRETDCEGVNQLLDECMSGPWHVGSAPRRFTSKGKVGQRWSDV